MGFFSKIKQNIHQGGVKVTLQAPASVSMQNPTIPVTVSIAASDASATIKKIQVEIIAESRNVAFSQPNNSGNMNNTQATRQTVARVESNEQFALNAGETKTVSLQIIMNQGNALESQLPQNSGMASVAHALGELQEVSERMNPAQHSYFIQATADVDGVTFDPSDTKPIQILKPGEFGAAHSLQVKL